MTRLAALLCIATSAHAQDRADIAGSIVSLQSTTEPGVGIDE